MPDNPHPLWRQKACPKGCGQNWERYPVGFGSDKFTHKSPSGNEYTLCTAPTEAEYIAQLEAKVAELEKK